MLVSLGAVYDNVVDSVCKELTDRNGAVFGEKLKVYFGDKTAHFYAEFKRVIMYVCISCFSAGIRYETDTTGDIEIDDIHVPVVKDSLTHYIKGSIIGLVYDDVFI